MLDLLTQPALVPLAQFMPLQIWSSVWPYLLMLLGFSVIVFVHELGHFSVAKWSGVKVDKFAIGFGREIFGFTRGETRYSFNMLPLGGYVKMLGQEDFDDKAKELQFKDDPRSFVNKPVGRRMAIVSAGVIMNTLFAGLLFMIVFMIGKEAVATRIASIVPDSPAERAGLLPGDVIRKINGEKILEFNEVRVAVMLAPLHEPIEFVVERDGALKQVLVEPEYLIPENTREAKRLIVGIAPGRSREIMVVLPELDLAGPDHPKVGDMLVEIDGVEITDENVNEVIEMIAYAKGDVVVERKDPDDPEAPPLRVAVNIPPMLGLYPTDDHGGSTSVLGLAPLVRVSSVDSRGRAYLAGIDVGDTILSWDDEPYPTQKQVARAVLDSPERDIYFRVRKRDGRVTSGFIRPKHNKRGPATIQALVEPIDPAESTEGGPKARFTDTRPSGEAARAGIEPGDLIVACNRTHNPTATKVNYEIRTNAGRSIAIDVRKADGRTIRTWVTPQQPGSIDAAVDLVADDLLRLADVVPTLNGKPSPAAQAGLEAGSLIQAVNGQPVTRWRELIDAFRSAAGTSVELAFADSKGLSRTTRFHVPQSLRTLLGVGPEARIVSIDGKRTTMIDMGRGRNEEVAIGYRKGTRAALTDLIGRTRVPVEYRADPLAEIKTAHVDVTEDMVDPWLGRITFSPAIRVGNELTLLKGKNPLDALWIGVHKTYYFMLQVYQIMERMIFTKSVSVDNISGPLGIIDLGGRIARTGLVEFVFFMGIISANLAVINFLPLPIVDGGLMVFLIVEKIKGSPVSLRVQIATQMIGLFLIIGLFLFVTFNDAMRLWG